MEQQLTRRRPFGVTVIVVLQLIGVVLLMLDVYVGQPIVPLPTFLGPRGSWLSPVSGGLSMIYHLVVAVGLWQLRRWAWFLIMIQLGLSMSLGLWLYFNQTPSYDYMLINIIMVFYLNQREVQRAFEHRSTAAEGS